MTHITKEYLNKILTQNDSGRLIWKERNESEIIGNRSQQKLAGLSRFNKYNAGSHADSVIDRHGYRKVKINNKQMKAHRVAYIMSFGEIPDGLEIDHVNGVRSDNKPSNLRAVLHQKNMKNKSLQSNNRTGYHGVRLHKCSGKFLASIKVNGKPIHLGLFPSIKEAVEVRRKAEALYGFDDNHGRGLLYNSTLLDVK